MYPDELIIKNAIEVIQAEAEAVAILTQYVGTSTVKAVRAIYDSVGRVVVSGIGKSAIIAQKMVATFNSTGTPALYMHAADAIHGDIGMIQPSDVVIVISKSGNSPEIKVLVPLIKNFGNTVIAISGNASSYLAVNADVFIDCTVVKEACPHNLAPTTSTTAQMVMGDVLAVCLLQMKGFTEQDFARFHPGGTLGKRLYLRVSDLSNMNAKPKVKPQSNLREVILEISGNRLGATVVIDDAGSLCGIITDGDLRRMLEKHENPAHLKAIEICSKNPKTINGNELATEALTMLRKYDITQLIVTNEGKYDGILHLHDLIREGII